MYVNGTLSGFLDLKIGLYSPRCLKGAYLLELLPHIFPDYMRSYYNRIAYLHY